MALIDKASLLMVPSVYEDGTLYNVLPSGNKAPDETGSHNGYDQTRADFTFSRGSNLAATRVNSSGLIEKGRENLLLQSNSFDESDWGKYNVSVTTGQADKDGGTTAFKITKTGVNGRVYQAITQTGINTASVFVKAGDSTFLRFYAAGPNANVYFDLSDGTFHSGSAYISYDIESVGNGWYRCSVTFAGAATIRIYPAEDNTTGGASGSIFIQDAQAEQGLVATDYIETGATTATAGVLENTPRIDYSSGAGALLLESQRTNIFTQSEFATLALVSNVNRTNNYTTSPEGVSNGTRLQFTANGFVGNNTQTNGTQYTLSCYAKRNDSGTQDVGFFQDGTGYVNSSWSLTSDWQRFTYTYTAANASYAGIAGISGADVSVYGFQMEAGSYATSYIPTYGSAATRGADSCIKTGISNLIGQTEGVVYLEVETIHNNSDTGATKWFLEVRKDANNSFGIGSGGADSAPTIRFVTKIAGVVSTDAEPAGFSNSKIAIKYTASEFKIFQNGSLKATISKSIGGYVDIEFMEGAGSRLTMPLKQFIVFDEVLTDAECQTLTA